MIKQYENPIIEIIEFNSENILTASGVVGGAQPGDNNQDYEDFWN